MIQDVIVSGGKQSGRTFTSQEFATLVKRDVRTLYAWKREGRLVPRLDFSNRYVYDEEDYELVMGKPYRE